tara:strand:- start:303 stop:584 length:282 start_codon:yes stop_codon:yes gene_type:complete
MSGKLFFMLFFLFGRWGFGFFSFGSFSSFPAGRRVAVRCTIYFWHNYLAFLVGFFAVLAAALNAASVGAPFSPFLRIGRPDALLALMLRYRLT